MKIYAIQPQIQSWVTSLRKTEAKDKICHLLCVPHHELLEAQPSSGNTVHTAAQSLVPRSYSRSLLSPPAYWDSSGRYGSEQPGLKTSPELCSCQHWLSWKLCSYQDCRSSFPKANAVNLGIFIFMKYLVKMCLHGGQAKNWEQNNTILRYGGMYRSEFGSPKLTGFICFVAICETVARVDLYEFVLISVNS